MPLSTEPPDLTGSLTLVLVHTRSSRYNSNYIMGNMFNTYSKGITVLLRKEKKK